MTTSSAHYSPRPATKLEWALYHLRHGWAIVPLWWICSDGQCACGKARCKPREHPLGVLAPHGYHNATRDPQRVQAWCKTPVLCVADAVPGRQRRQVPVQNVLDTLGQGEKVSSVARRLGISRAMVYRLMATVRGVSR